MEQSLSSEANSNSASQEILQLLWNNKFHYRARYNPPLLPTISQMHLVHSVPSYFHKIHSNIILPLRLGLPRYLFPSGFPTTIFIHFSFLQLR